MIEHLERMNLTPMKCRPLFQPLKPRWGSYYWVVTQDGEGHKRSGLAGVTGRDGRTIRIDWADERPGSALEALGRALRRHR